MHLDSLLPVLLDLFPKSAFVLAVAGGLLLAARRSSAANRHVIAAAAVVTLLLLPFTKLARPLWSYEMEATAPRAAMAANPPPAATSRAAKTLAESGPAALPESLARPTISRLDRSALVVAAWAAGALLLLIQRAGSEWQLRGLARQSRPVQPGRVLELVRTLASASGLRVALRESEKCGVPMAFGICRPTVLLPANALEWSDDLLSAALRHELGHLRRRDCLTRLLADLACVFYWVNPLVWAGARVLRLAQEQACDDLVLRSGTPARTYARQLVQVVRSVQHEPCTVHPAAAMAQSSTLEIRVRSIVEARRDRSPQSRRAFVAGLLSVAAALALCLTAQVRAAEQDKSALAHSRGLAYLADHQQEDGSIGSGQFRGSVGLTSLAGLALMGDGAHAGRVKQAATFILSCQSEDGFLGGKGVKRGSMYDHGYATLFLAEYWKSTAETGGPEGLAKAVEVIVKSQGKEGGWRYLPTPAGSDTSMTACQLMALVAARKAGATVPAATIEAGVAFLKGCQNGDGGFGYTTAGNSAFPRSAAALTAALATAKWIEPASRPDATKGAEYVMGFLPQAGGETPKDAFFQHGSYYAGQALHLVGGSQWARWRDTMHERLLATQKADGSWPDDLSVELATSEACLTLRVQKTAPGK